MTWQAYAFMAALAGGATAVLAKIGVEPVPPNLGMAVRPAVVMALAKTVVLMRGEQSAWSGISLRKVFEWELLVVASCGHLLADSSMCPPNSNRIADRSLSANSVSPRELNRE